MHRKHLGLRKKTGWQVFTLNFLKLLYVIFLIQSKQINIVFILHKLENVLL